MKPRLAHAAGMARRHLSPWVALAVLGVAALPPVTATDPRIDLAGDVYPVQTAPGVPTSLYAYVWNGYPDDTSLSFNVEVRVDGALLDAFRVEDFGWGGVEYLTDASFVPTGVHELSIRVDANDEVPELDESNNAWAYRVLFTNEPGDLETTVLATRVEGWPRSHAELDVRVCNVGAGPTLAEGALWGWLNKPYLPSPLALGSASATFSAPLPRLAAGACVERTFQHDATNWVGNAAYAIHATLEMHDPFVFEPTYDNNHQAGRMAFGPQHARL